MTTKQINLLKRENKKLKVYNKGYKEGATSDSQIDLANAFKKQLKLTASSQEIKMIKLLTECGYNFEFQKVVYTNPSFIILDFVLEKQKIVIEIDGGQHFNSDKIASDKNRDSYLKKLGYKTLRLSNSKVANLTIIALKAIIKDFKNNNVYKKVREYKDYEILTFGKHKGLSIKEICNLDKKYLVWMYRSLMATYSKNILDKLGL